MYLNPCMDRSCTSYAGGYFILHWTVGTIVQYPLIRQPLSITAAQSAFEIGANVSSAGRIWCAALSNNSASGQAVTAEYVRQIGSQVTADAAGTVNVTLRGLTPASGYRIVCLTEDFEYHSMPVSVALETSVLTQTLCCRQIKFTQITSVLLANQTSSSSTWSTFQLAIDAAPEKGALAVNVRLSICSNQTKTTTKAKATPAQFVFAANAKVLWANFVLSGSPGCYVVSASSANSLYMTASASVTLLSVNASVPAPVLKSAAFSDDGTQVIVGFDSHTDRGQTRVTNYDTSFRCSQMLSFDGSTTSACIWSTDMQLVITLQQSTMVPSGTISLLSGVVRAFCSRSSEKCGYAGASSVVVVGPLNPIVPTVSLSTAGTVSSCDDIVIDPTSSTGNGGRQWRRLMWNVTVMGSNTASGVAIAAYLNTHFSTTAKVATIPNSFLSPARYVISLQLSNLFRQTAVQSVTIAVEEAEYLPMVSISGGPSVSMYRWQSLSLFALAQWPQNCGSLVYANIALSYRWAVYAGFTLLADVSSKSVDTRFFTLPAYSLQPLTTYTFKVTVFGSDSSSKVQSNYVSMRLTLGRSGVQAVIAGGSARTLGSAQSLSLDASGSSDLDFPDSAQLSYNWSCSVIASTAVQFGASCAKFPYGTSASAIAWSASQPSTYLVSVVVSNVEGFFGVANTTVVVIGTTRLPYVVLSGSEVVVNSGTLVTVTGQLLGDATMQAEWSMKPGNLSSVQLSPRAGVIGATGSSWRWFQLAISSGQLVPGIQYDLTLSVSYVGSNAASSARISLLVNRAPVGGAVSISPAEGIAVNTEFYYLTSGWTSASSAYPLSFVLGYYITSPASVSIVKTQSVVMYATSVMAPGLPSSNYRVTGFASATDMFGANANTTTYATVRPVASLTGLSEEAAASSLSDAIVALNAVSVSQLVGAYTLSLNTVNCSVPLPCAGLNREQCQYTAHTCGGCLVGYTGVPGDSNYACQLTSAYPVESKIRVCSKDNQCAGLGLGRCVSGQCAIEVKQCANNCSGYGECILSDANGEEVEFCESTDSFCKATCSCRPSRFGSDCSLNATAFRHAKQLRQLMCASLYATVDLQDLDATVITSRANSVSLLLLDMTQMTDYALRNCTAVLTETIESGVQYIVDANVANQCYGALSGVLSKGSSLPSELLADVISSIALLADQMQSLLVIGQSASVVVAGNVRLSSRMVELSDLASTTFYPPRTGIESVRGASSGAVRLQVANTNTSASANATSAASHSLGVTLMQFTSSPYNSTTDSVSVGLRVTEYSKQAIGSRRRLSSVREGVHSFANGLTSVSSSEAVSIDVHLTLDNIHPVQYPFSFAHNGTVYCHRHMGAYNVTVECEDVGLYNITCEGTFFGTKAYTCPYQRVLPVCEYWDGQAFAANPRCTPKTFSPKNTTCLCEAENASYRRQLSSSGNGFGQFSSAHVQLTNELVFSLLTTYDMTPEVVFTNEVVLSFSTVISAIALLGLIYFVPVDYIDIKKLTIEKKKKKRSILSIADVIVNSTPVEFTLMKWYSVWAQNISVKHCWFSLISRFSEFGDYRSVDFMAAMSYVVSTLFLNTVLALTIYDDDGRCETISTKSSCLGRLNINHFDTVCQWDDTIEFCSYNDDEKHKTLNILVSSLFVCMLSLPLTQVYSELIAQAKLLLLEKYVPKRPLTRHQRNVASLTIHDQQTLRCTVFRAARLVVMQQAMERKTIDEEVNVVESNLNQHRILCKAEDLLQSSRRDGPLLSGAKQFIDGYVLQKQLHHIISVKPCEPRLLIKHRLMISRETADLMIAELKYVQGSEEKTKYL
jgi:hypothetical protein